ncbi:alpha-1,4-glucan--maltose-1-phosphate maltosyltransferase [Egibacter rhizosphaerae]|uniref:Alpha-1,4-glucan:maltose-1-phosphate maltosyltransferase n=1 Tax=Egibacter rhizosphaerae TaxID=1670831 RepID=A0A411YAI9_9ACTN|nr:alpha-1,4-glucan--maltose-1-phosphate maltosyltransferase [Egibacter rhizosphaerae]QBI18198.1 alpha-1,4-glucan--maltose-1-phosphate maltosyltransferase [Egibacter rhizosphaerae]
MRGRIEIAEVEPVVDCGRYAAKAVVGDEVTVGADLLREGHDHLAAAVAYRAPGERSWRETPMRLDTNDRWLGTFGVDRMGPWSFAVGGWTDHYGTWADGIRKKHAAGQTDLDVAIEDGARLLERRTDLPAAASEVIAEVIAVLRGTGTLSDKVAAATDADLLALLERHPERLDLTWSAEYPLWIDRERARFSAWYEMFPRSEGAFWPAEGDDRSPRSGTFETAAKRLPAIAEMGFDVVYLPPVHPIGRTYRKGSGGPHDLDPQPGDPGVPWAIGGPEGGHTAIHPDLGTLEDFDAFVAEAQRHGLEVAMDYAIQCSPDHPWVTEHPQWFRHRSDGTIAYAENPPKKYQDIYPLDFDTSDRENLWQALREVLEFWIARGIRVFRVDNPHTKALPFWEWVIAELRREHPELIFLAEAFTRPKMMATLAKLGFNQSYTYFAWRNTKEELTEYATQLAYGEVAKYYRPNFWPNTPDILTEFLQTGGRPAFKLRLVLAALLSPSYGIYAGYELCENVPLEPGSEEYLGSEKYRFRPREWDRSDSLAPYIARINWIRREHRALRDLSNVWFHEISDPAMLCFSKVAPGRTDPILVIVNLDPHHPREATTALDLGQLGLEGIGPFEAHDLLTDTTYLWHGPHNYVRLDPDVEPSHVLHLRAL